MSDLSEFRADKPFTSNDVAEVHDVLKDGVRYGTYDAESSADLARLIEESEIAVGLVRDLHASLPEDVQARPEIAAALGTVNVLDLFCHVYRNVMTDEERAEKNIAGLLNVLSTLALSLAVEEDRT